MQDGPELVRGPGWWAASERESGQHAPLALALPPWQINGAETDLPCFLDLVL